MPSTLSSAARIHVWRPWDADALAHAAVGGPLAVEPAPWATPEQSRRMLDFIDELLAYPLVLGLPLASMGETDPHRHLRRAVAARLVALIEAGVRVRWRIDPETGGTGLRFLARGDGRPG